MLILTIRTDKPEAEIGLYDGEKKLAYETWHGHRNLSETIHKKIKKVLGDQQKDFEDISGVVVYKGPGSFTGLRIGISVANALADGLGIPIAGTSGSEWISQGIEKILNGTAEKQVLPEYGATARTTKPRK